MKVVLILILALFYGCAKNAGITLPHSKIHDFESRINKVKYRLFLITPKDYAISNQKYPVVYMLDGHYSVFTAAPSIEMLSDRGKLPKMIIVGISYQDNDVWNADYKHDKIMSPYRKNRTRDYTPIRVPIGGEYELEYTHSGGADDFHRVIKDEIKPLIEQNYRTNGSNTIVGHSYGGLFVTWALLNRGDFDNYIAISPSFWYADNWILSGKITENLHGKLYIAVGSDETKRMVDGYNSMRNILTSKTSNGFEMKSEIIKNEKHFSIFPATILHGLNFVFNSQ